jgi:peptide/nickel transport system substrate-binding protein
MNSSGALMGSIDGTAVTLSFKLLVNKDDAVETTVAKDIIGNLNKSGVVVTLDAEPADVYSTMLAQNNFDLYLGQINLTDDMDLTPLLSAGGAAAFGVPQPSATMNAFNDWRLGKADIKSVVTAFSDETPFIPICYKYGSVSYTKGLKGTVAPTYYDIFRSIENWHF